ncbi:MAG: methylmalonyl Co-A mutase-associated GTPase MeaB [Polyangiaceae bacterium]|nr:methylmalonyl Co-A mutase-associated GTPase MeaB [Polyangiaceae bacterium]
MDGSDLARRLVERERVAIGKALSLVENRRADTVPRILELLTALHEGQHTVAARRIGFTGPPGAGKSTLVAAVARELRARERRVGILAVDPTSRRSGGALLGDRARIDPDADDEGIFVRSMASGGDLGGLARAAASAVEVLAACHDVVIIETVGVGQSETDVECVADVTALVMQPASGDVLQFLKAGILEIPDVFVVNKMDLGGVAQRTRSELTAALQTARAAGVWSQPAVILGVSARSGQGIAQLVDALGRTFDEFGTGAALASRRTQAAGAWAERMLARTIGEIGFDALGGRPAVRSCIAQQLRGAGLGMRVVADLTARAVQNLRESALR